MVVILDDINEGNTHAYNKEYLAFDNSKFTTINNMVEGETLEIYVKFKYLENEEITASIIDVGIYEVFVSTYTVRGGNIDNYSFSQDEVYNYEITKRDVYMSCHNS